MAARTFREKKRVTRKLKEVSRFSSAKQRQGSVENSVLHMQKCFLLIRYIVVVFYRSRCLHRCNCLVVLIDFIFSLRRL